jgi:serine/threonine protein phosphatase PrpC
MDLKLDVGRRTDVGRRRPHNEDCLGIYPPEIDGTVPGRGKMFVVADGMGGYAAGEVASHIAVEEALNSYFNASDTAIGDSLARALQQANRAVIHEASREADHAGMGATMAVAVLLDRELYVANVGDSRVYLLHEGVLTQISRDHSWVADLVALGQITPEEALHHPRRNVVTRSIGGRPEVEVEVYPPLRLHSGDVVLLCSDGLWGMVVGDRIRTILESRSAQAAADALVAAANEAGGHDNITAVVCRVLTLPGDEEGEHTETLDAVNLSDTQPMPRLETQ